MTSYKNIKRIATTNDHTDEYVSLVEYIIFESEKLDKNYIVFKFRNNLEQYLYEVGFTVYQYTKDGEICEKSNIEYKNFRCGNYDTFVPEQKLRANSLTQTVSVELKYALFEKLIFEDGVTKPITYNFQDYLNDVKQMEEREGMGVKVKKKLPEERVVYKSETKKEKLTKYQKKRLKKLKRKKILLTDITKQNKTKAMPIFVFFTSVIFVVLTFLISTYFYNTTNTLKHQGVKYNLNWQTQTLTVTGYTSALGKEAIIPEAVNGRKVTAIETGAFTDATMTSVVISGDIVVKSGSFKNCANLTEVTIYGNSTIETYAFMNSENITTINAQNSVIEAYAFEHLTGLKRITFKSSTAKSYKNMFYGFSTDTQSNPTVIVSESFYQTARTKGFFDGATVNVGTK